jgi:hypothetical protein
MGVAISLDGERAAIIDAGGNCGALNLASGRRVEIGKQNGPTWGE